MRATIPALAFSLLGTASLLAVEASPHATPKPQPAAENLDWAKELVATRAVVQITRPEGVCYWQIAGADGLARLPVKDSGYGNLLLSAQIVGDRLQIAVAGEGQPLETTFLGRYSLDYPGPEVEMPRKSVAADSLRFGGREAWTFSLVSRRDFFDRRTKGGVQGCCTCNTYKLTCCPSAGSCMGCGTCGDCCD